MPPFTAVMGCISVFNLIVKLDDMINMKNVLMIVYGWAGAVLGSSLQDNQTDTASDITLIDGSCGLRSVLKRFESSLLTKYKDNI